MLGSGLIVGTHGEGDAKSLAPIGMEREENGVEEVRGGEGVLQGVWHATRWVGFTDFAK